MFVRRVAIALLAAVLTAAAASAPVAGAAPKGGPFIGQHSLRAPVTDETFYFVMADRFANGSTANDTGGISGDRLQHGFDPTHRGFYQRRRPAGPAGADRLHRGSWHDLHLAHPELQEQGRATGGRPVGGLPRVLGDRLHPDRPAPGHQRPSCAPWLTRRTSGG